MSDNQGTSMKQGMQCCVLAGLLVVGWWLGSGIAADRSVIYDPDTRVMLNPSGAMVTVQHRTLKFFQSDGKPLKSRELRGNEYAILPEGGSVVGITRFFDNSPSTLTAAAFELVDLTGKRLYGIDKPRFSSVIVSATGSAIVGIDGAEGLPQSVLRFYDARGNEAHAMTVEFFQGGRFSSDGSVFVFTTAKEGLLACSTAGQVLARYGMGTSYDLSAGGEVFAVAQDSVLRVYANGKRQTTIHTMGQTRAVTVSGNGKHVGWAGTADAVIYAAGADSALVRVQLSAPGENVRSLAISNDGRCFAIGIDIDAGKEAAPEARHFRGRAVVYDFAGQKIAEKELSYQAWNAHFPAVSFTRDGHTVAVITREEISLVELPSPVPSE